MAEQGLEALDSDVPVIEPPDPWQKYLESRCRDRAAWGMVRGGCAGFHER